MKYQELKKATEIFGLTERASLELIKKRYRELVKKHHPDQSGDRSSEDIHKINAAYETLLDYCNNYFYCFSEEEFLEQVPSEKLRRQFGSDPLWGGTNEDK